jgi:hypothetical protein
MDDLVTVLKRPDQHRIIPLEAADQRRDVTTLRGYVIEGYFLEVMTTNQLVQGVGFSIRDA